jgi:hypothetical protein
MPSLEKVGLYMLFLIYPVESPTIYGGDEKNVHSLLRVGFKAPPRGVQGRNSTGPALSDGVNL